MIRRSLRLPKILVRSSSNIVDSVVNAVGRQLQERAVRPGGSDMPHRTEVRAALNIHRPGRPPPYRRKREIPSDKDLPSITVGLSHRYPDGKLKSCTLFFSNPLHCLFLKRFRTILSAVHETSEAQSADNRATLFRTRGSVRRTVFMLRLARYRSSRFLLQHSRDPRFHSPS